MFGRTVTPVDDISLVKMVLGSVAAVLLMLPAAAVGLATVAVMIPLALVSLIITGPLILYGKYTEKKAKEAFMREFRGGLEKQHAQTLKIIDAVLDAKLDEPFHFDTVLAKLLSSKVIALSSLCIFSILILF
jgi:uncharacterized membrane protein